MWALKSLSPAESLTQGPAPSIWWSMSITKGMKFEFTDSYAKEGYE